MNNRTRNTLIANTAPVSTVAFAGGKLVALVLVLITPLTERDECLT